MRLRHLLSAALVAVAAAVPAVIGGSSQAAIAPSFTVLADAWSVPAGGAEIVALSPTNTRWAAVTAAGAERVALLDLKNPSKPKQKCAVDTSAYGEPTSVAFHPSGGYAVTAIKNDPNPGTALAFSLTDCATMWTVLTGIGPDAIVFNSQGIAAIAIEDEETEVGDVTSCAPNFRAGRVDLLDPRTSPPTVTPVELDVTGIAGINCPEDPQPENLAFSKNGQILWVTLQENNAIVKIDVASATMTKARSLGTTTHLADTVEDDIPAVDDPFEGRREPDGVTLSRDGKWLFTADEGDTDHDAVWSGGRTISVVDAKSLKVVADTGAQIESTAVSYGFYEDDRAENRGPEVEGMAIFSWQGRDYLVATVERYESIIVFEVTNPKKPVAVAMVGVGDEPESVVFDPVRRLLIVASEADGEVSVIKVG